MILTEVRIENYKRYAGRHVVSFREQGLVAVIGANGVGKTTLFEAIEWCLYKPIGISNDSVLTRNGTGATKVEVVLTNPETGISFVVERKLRQSGGILASVYQVDKPEAPIVQGTSEVTRYVAGKLIGLDYRAFVSTFFTRQKELGFFAGRSTAERRRDVSRLLGHDAIEVAQKSMADAKSGAKNRADDVESQYAAAAQGRDLTAERERADLLLSDAELAVRDRTAVADNAKMALEAATSARAALSALQLQDREHELMLSRVDTDRRLADQQAADTRARLSDLDRDETRRAALMPVASLETERVAVLEHHRAEQQREQNRQQLARQLRDLDDALTRLAEDLRAAVNAVPGGDQVDGWAFDASDAADPVAGARRLLRVVADLPLEAANQRFTDIERCRALAVQRDAAVTAIQRLRDQAAGLERDRDALLLDGDPRVRVEVVTRELNSLRDEHVSLTKEISRAQSEAEPFERMIETIEKSDFTAGCPTCRRPFTNAQAQELLTPFKDSLARLTGEIDQLQASLRSVIERGQEKRAEEKQSRLAAEAFVGALSRIETLKGQIEAGEQSFEQARQALLHELGRCGLPTEPDDRTLQDARSYAAMLHAVANTGRELERISRDGVRIAGERERIGQELAAFGSSTYDASAHKLAEEAVQESRDARGQIVVIDERLANRPALLASLTAIGERLALLAAEHDQIMANRRALGFDPLALANAVSNEDLARSHERAAHNETVQATTYLAEQRRARDAVFADASRIEELHLKSISLRREADDLERMRQEFSAFDRYVASRVTPVLAEHTAEFLAAVTDHRYDRVEFSDDYELRVFDDDRSFPIDEFSGGERDAVSLCARLALSAVIGAQAAHPPQFVVLDEVFGSLDEHRRAMVLQTLRELTGGSEALSQMFVISHVEDINSSPLVDEVWRVTNQNGSSQLIQDERSGTMTPEMADLLNV